LLLLSIDASAQFSLGDPTYLGSGCPKGTVQTITSNDSDQLTVLFSDYIAQTSDDDKMDRVSCNLAIPIDVESGYSVGIFKIEYRGYTNFINDESDDDDTYTEFSVEYFFAGVRGDRLSKKFYESGDVYIDDEVGAAVYTECGDNTILRVNTAIMAKKDDDDDPDVEIGIDSTDVSVDYEFRYYLHTSKC